MSLDEMQEYCVGEMGISPKEFWFMTPREVQNAIRGHVKKKDEAIKQKLNQDRFLAFNYWASKYPKQIKSVYQIAIYPWDEVENIHELRKKGEFSESAKRTFANMPTAPLRNTKKLTKEEQIKVLEQLND